MWYSFCCSLGNWILDVYYVFGACSFCNKTCGRNNWTEQTILFVIFFSTNIIRMIKIKNYFCVTVLYLLCIINYVLLYSIILLLIIIYLLQIRSGNYNDIILSNLILLINNLIVECHYWCSPVFFLWNAKL